MKKKGSVFEIQSKFSYFFFLLSGISSLNIFFFFFFAFCFSVVCFFNTSAYIYQFQG